jgi:hypothetical protein
MAKFLDRRERTTLRRRGGREVVRTRVMHGDWILREEFHLVEPGFKPGSKSFTLYASQEAVERALDLACGSGITRSDQGGQEYWHLSRRRRKPEREPWRLS